MNVNESRESSLKPGEGKLDQLGLNTLHAILIKHQLNVKQPYKSVHIDGI